MGHLVEPGVRCLQCTNTNHKYHLAEPSVHAICSAQTTIINGPPCRTWRTLSAVHKQLLYMGHLAEPSVRYLQCTWSYNKWVPLPNLTYAICNVHVTIIYGHPCRTLSYAICSAKTTIIYGPPCPTLRVLSAVHKH